MRRSALGILAILSLALLPILLSSYAFCYGPLIDHVDTSRRCRICALLFSTGLIEFSYDEGVGWDGIRPGWHCDIFHLPPVPFRRIRENLWTFRAGTMGGATLFALTFPAWLPALLCTIAPLLWLRRPRKIKAPGFAVEPPAMAEETGRQE